MTSCWFQRRYALAMTNTRWLSLLTLTVIAAAVTGCASTPTPTPTPTVTVTVAPEPEFEAAGDAWQRFRDDPREAFVFASAYEIIWGTPIGNGELANSVVELSATICDQVANGTAWVEIQNSIDDEDAEKYILTAQVYCPDVGM